MGKQIPLSSFEMLVNKAIELVKNSGRGGIYQTRLLGNMAHGGKLVPTQVIPDLFAVLQQHGVIKAEDGSNPKWKFLKQEIPAVKVPPGLASVEYPSAVVSPEQPLDFVVAEVTSQDVIQLVAPKIREFMLKQSGPVTKAQLLQVAREVLGGRDLPENLFGRMCFVGQVARPDSLKDEYFRTRSGRRSPKGKSKEVMEGTTKPRGRPRKDVSAPASVVGVVELPASVKLVIGENQLSLTLMGDVSAVLEHLKLPFKVTGGINELTLTAGQLNGTPQLPWVSFSPTAGSVGIETPINLNLKIGRILISGPWKNVILRQRMTF